MSDRYSLAFGAFIVRIFSTDGTNSMGTEEATDLTNKQHMVKAHVAELIANGTLRRGSRVPSLLDLARQRRLRHMQARRRAPEMQRLGDGHEIAEAAKVRH